MPDLKPNLFERLGLFMYGADYYQTKLLAKALLNRYGFERFYTLKQIQLSAASIGYETHFDQAMASALFGSPKEAESQAEYARIRAKSGLIGEGALEVFKVYLGVEKQVSDPFGSDQARETTDGLS